jgi:hypothetical protein
VSVEARGRTDRLPTFCLLYLPSLQLRFNGVFLSSGASIIILKADNIIFT